MTTSSSDSRCTRISPSAVLDDRLDGKDLEWARDHLRRCESCRERVEDFREMLLRVGRLPKAGVGPAAMDQAFAAAIPERLREESSSRSFDLRHADAGRLNTPMADVPPPMYPEITNVSDLMTELEREIFHDEPAQDHPTPFSTIAESNDSPAANHLADHPLEEATAETDLAQNEPVIDEPAADEQWREVPIDSHRELVQDATPAIRDPEVLTEPEPAAWTAPIKPEPEAWMTNQPEPEAVRPTLEPEPEPELAPVAWLPQTEPEPSRGIEPRTSTNAVFDHEPALPFDEPEEAPTRAPRKSDNAMRLAVGLGAAACVLLAAVLYEGGNVLKLGHLLSATSPTAATSLRPSVSASKSTAASATAAPRPTPTATPATVLFTFDGGASGGSVFRIRPGTAVAGFTRLVFDMHGSGLPTMLVTQPDANHVQVIFNNTTVAGVPVSDIHSYHVAAVEPGVQQGANGSFLIDLAHPVRVTAFTLNATGGYAWRLVVDLHST